MHEEVQLTVRLTNLEPLPTVRSECKSVLILVVPSCDEQRRRSVPFGCYPSSGRYTDTARHALAAELVEDRWEQPATALASMGVNASDEEEALRQRRVEEEQSVSKALDRLAPWLRPRIADG